jgi:hypothetical protein
MYIGLNFHFEIPDRLGGRSSKGSKRVTSTGEKKSKTGTTRLDHDHGGNLEI